MNKPVNRPLVVEMPLEIRGYDIDVLHIVSNIVYIRWYEDLRQRFLDTYYPFQEMLQEGISPVLSETHAEYKYPLTIFDKPAGRIWVSDLTRSRWTCSFEIFTENRLNCQGFQKGYFFNVERKRPVAIPEKLQKLYAQEIGQI